MSTTHSIVIAGCTVARSILLIALLAIRVIGLAQTHTDDPELEAVLETADELQGSGRSEHALALLDSMQTVMEKRDPPVRTDRLIMKRAFIHQMIGNVSVALKELYKAERIRERFDDQEGLAEVYNHIGSIYHKQKDHERAGEQYMRSLGIYSTLGNATAIAQVYNNIGALYQDKGEPARALEYHRKSLVHWSSIEELGWMGVCYMHMGVCKEKLGEPDSARFYLERSLAIMKIRKSDFHISLLYNLLGVHYLNTGRLRDARASCEQGLRIAVSLDLLEQQRSGCECLFKVHEKLGDLATAFGYHRRTVALQDSLFNEEKAKELTRLEMNHAFDRQQLADSLIRARKRSEAELRHQTEILQERQGRDLALLSGLGVLLLAGGLWNRLRYIRRSRAVIKHERDRSDELLLNILPSDTARELKETGTSKARRIETVSVLFTDFKGFTEIAQRSTPEDLVADLHECFSAFDRIMERHGIEKIKTIGDAYMAAGGLPVPNTTHALDVIHAALEIRDFIAEGKARKAAAGLPYFEVRIGIHTGPVVAGIVGVKKFSYDIWGDTVNTASRMESSGEVGQVNISEATYELVKNEQKFSFTPRGKVKAKGKGELEMYFVRRSLGEG